MIKTARTLGSPCAGPRLRATRAAPCRPHRARLIGRCVADAKPAPAAPERHGAGDNSSARFKRCVVLVGLMGAGKTTIGRRLARALALPFVDADEEIERAAGRSVADIFSTYGEAHFRDGERRVIARLLACPPMVLATGGGAFVDASTRMLIKASAISIWLNAELDVLVRRVSRRNTRPLLTGGDPRAVLERLLLERAPFYAEADITIDSPPGPHERTVEAIVSALDAWAGR